MEVVMFQMDEDCEFVAAYLMQKNEILLWENFLGWKVLGSTPLKDGVEIEYPFTNVEGFHPTRIVVEWNGKTIKVSYFAADNFVEMVNYIEASMASKVARLETSIGNVLSLERLNTMPK